MRVTPMHNFSIEQQELIRFLQESGDYQSESEVIDEALELLRQREELRRQLDVATNELDLGQGVLSEGTIQQLQAEQ